MNLKNPLFLPLNNVCFVSSAPMNEQMTYELYLKILGLLEAPIAMQTRSYIGWEISTNLYNEFKESTQK